MFESIWNSQSILSANNDIYQLHFVRWKKDEEWTPWNCILLTLDEAESHLKLKNLEAVCIFIFNIKNEENKNSNFCRFRIMAKRSSPK